MSVLGKRVRRLECRVGPYGRVRLCWVGEEPKDMKPGEKLIAVSWEDEEAE